MDISYILTRKIQQLSHRIVLRRNKDLKSMGLTAEQADTLLFFHAHSGSSASDLRCSLGVTHQAAGGQGSALRDAFAARCAVQADCAHRRGRGALRNHAAQLHELR